MGDGVEDLCRLCASFDPVRMPIFSMEGLQRNLVNKILTCLRFKVNENDGFPSSVCYKCIFNLESFYDFYEMTVRAQKTLQGRVMEFSGKAELMFPSMAPCVRQPPAQEERRPQITTSGVPNVERPFPCDLCPTSFMSAKDRWTHVSQNHKGDARITCIFCRKGFSTISNLNFHKKNKHKEEMDEWDRKMKPIPKLQKINELPKIQNKTYETVRNFLNNKTETILQDAKQADLTNFNVKIGNTDIKFGGTRTNENKSMIDRLKNLGVEVSTGNVKNNELQYDDKFQNPQDLLELDLGFEGGENLENMIESETVFGCEVCLRDFKDRSSLWLHMLYSHKNEAGYTCGMCLKLCLGYKELNEHINSCKELNENEKRRYYCNICFRQHESKKKLETHTAIHNLNDPWIQENLDLNNLISSNPTATEKLKMEENEDLSDTYSQEMDVTNDSTQHSSGQSGYLNQQDQLAYQSFLESSGHFLESSSFFDDVKIEPEVKLDGNQEEKNKFRCEDCFRTYDTALQLTKHKYNVHKNPNRLVSRNDSFGNPVFECEFCGETYENPKLLMKHRYNAHRNPHQGAQISEDPARPNYACGECPRSFETPRQLQKHKYNVHKTSRKIPIPMGGESPSSVDSFKPTLHYSYSFDCEICGERAASKTERWKHCYKEHKDDPRLVCDAPDCKKVMPTESFRKEHQTYHEQQGKFPICCEICSKLWTSKVEFWKHVSGVHYSLIGLTCGVCMKMFLTLDELKEHVQTHEPLSEAEFNCDICGRGYSSKPKMTRHRLIHENDPENDEYNILKHTLLKGGNNKLQKYEILNIPKVNRSFENDLEIIEVNPDDNGVDGDQDDGIAEHLWCDVCPDLTFNDLDELRTHRRNIHALYPCDLCPKFYGGVSHLWKHTNRSHKNHPDITCTVCGKTSASRIQLRGHVNKNHKEILLGHMVGDAVDPDPTNLNCRRCGKEFRIRSLVRRHERVCLTKTDFDPDPNNLNCSNCGKYYPARALVRRHERLCLNPLSLNCKVCGKEFPKRSYCRRHERTCGTKKERPPKEEGPVSLQCEWCPKVFNSRRAYAGHVDYMHSLVECEVCTEERVAYRSKTDLYNHCKEKHADHPELLCPLEKCRRLLRTKADLDRHQREHKNRDNPPTCEFCADVFKGRKKLRIHILHQHKTEEGRKFICGVCVKVLDDTPSLIVHINEAHAKLVDRDYTCRICARAYNCNAKVLEHIKNTHDGMYKPCKICLKVYQDDAELETHLKEHANKDGNQCCVCPSSFETVMELYEHVKSEHKSSKDPMCPVCARKYHSIYTAYDHLENKHGDTFYGCRKCLAVFTDPEERTQHLATHGSVEEAGSLTCTRCDTPHESEEELATHIRVAHADLFEEFSDRSMCLVCSKVLKYKYSLYVHIEKHHKSVFACRSCLMIYNDKADLDAHYIKLHTRDKDGNPPLLSPGALNKRPPNTKKKNQCYLCQGLFNTVEEMRLHVADAHPEIIDKEMTCTICAHTYSSRFKVYYHVATVHGEPYKCCRKCGKIYLSAEELQEHDATHEIEEVKAKPPKRKAKEEEEVVVNHEKRTRPQRARSKILNNYVLDIDEVDDEEQEEEDDEEEAASGVMETEETVVDPDQPSEEVDDSEYEDNETDDEDKDEGDEPDDEVGDEVDEEEEEEDEEEEVDDDEDEEKVEEESADEDGEDGYAGKIEAKVDGMDDQDNYTCEAVDDASGDDKFRLKIKHSSNSLKKEDAETESPPRKRKRSSVINGTDGLISDLKNLTSCVAE